MVPGSTFRYGSSFCMLTSSPRALSSRPRLEAVRPLPRLDATPPVTKRCFVSAWRDASKGRLPWSVRGGEAARPRAIRISAGAHTGPQRRRPCWSGCGGGLVTGRGGGSALAGAGGGGGAGLGGVVGSGLKRVRGGLAVGRLPDPALRRREALLIGLPEPGQGDRADDGQAESK